MNIVKSIFVHNFFILTFVVLITACGGGSTNDSAANNPDNQDNLESPPNISGTPITTIEENVAYNFAPTASDPDGDQLVFTINNSPSWASFDAATGKLSGTPGNADVGTTQNIVISVTDGTNTVSLPAFDITVTSAVATTGTASLSWLPPTENTDGSPLTNLQGYKIYYGTTPGVYPNVITIDNPGISSYVVENLSENNTYYFVLTAYNTNGVESSYSDMISKSI